VQCKIQVPEPERITVLGWGGYRLLHEIESGTVEPHGTLGSVTCRLSLSLSAIVAFHEAYMICIGLVGVSVCRSDRSSAPRTVFCMFRRLLDLVLVLIQGLAIFWTKRSFRGPSQRGRELSVCATSDPRSWVQSCMGPGPGKEIRPNLQAPITNESPQWLVARPGFQSLTPTIPTTDRCGEGSEDGIGNASLAPGTDNYLSIYADPFLFPFFPNPYHTYHAILFHPINTIDDRDRFHEQ